MVFSENKVVRDSWELACRIKKGTASQPWKSRSSVDKETSLGVQVSKPYLGLTEAEYVEKFKMLGSKH